MRILRPGVDFEAFFRGLPAAPARALVLDYDGTLAPFRERPESALPYPGVREALAAIQRGGGTTLILVSGRPAAAMLDLLGLDPMPELWGSHGQERVRSGKTENASELAADDRSAVAALEAWIAEHAGEKALERKPFGVAIHWRDRAREEARTMRERAIARFRSAIEGTGLEVLEFHGGVEVRPRGIHKGVVIEKLLSELPPGAAVAFLGDDRTDEDAFQALAGKGLSVLVRQELRETAADLWITPPEELLDFLAHWNRAIAL